MRRLMWVTRVGSTPRRPCRSSATECGTPSSKAGLAQNLAGDVASWHAAILNLRYTETDERLSDCAWYRDPAPYVELHITARRTEAARLHMWVRERDGLQGYVTYLERPARDGGRWAPAAALRPLTPDEMEEFAERQAARRRVSRAA
jgi:hypothetical protein